MWSYGLHSGTRNAIATLQTQPCPLPRSVHPLTDSWHYASWEICLSWVMGGSGLDSVRGGCPLGALWLSHYSNGVNTCFYMIFTLHIIKHTQLQYRMFSSYIHTTCFNYSLQQAQFFFSLIKLHISNSNRTVSTAVWSETKLFLVPYHRTQWH